MNRIDLRRSEPSVRRKLQLFDHFVERMLRVTGCFEAGGGLSRRPELRADAGALKWSLPLASTVAV